MFILSDQVIILFSADTFFRKQLIFRPHYKRNKYKLLEKQSCVSVCVCFARTAPDTVNLVLKQKLYLVLKKKKPLK